MKNVVLSLSGGLDSSTLLLRCLDEYDNIIALSFDYGQKHKIELEKAQELVEYLNSNCEKTEGGYPLPLNIFENHPFINHKIIKLEGLSELLNSTLVEGGDEVPEGHYEQDNMKESVVENRNKIFSSIIQAAALSVANKTENNCDIALGIHSGDHTIYPDTTEDFIKADEKAFKIGNWNSNRVNYYTPYIKGNKFTILKNGEELCEKLGLDFNEVYKKTNTSYKPYPSGNSDYKSASSVERILAFIEIGKKDPITYEDENGIASWEKVKNHALEIEKNFKS